MKKSKNICKSCICILLLLAFEPAFSIGQTDSMTCDEAGRTIITVIMNKNRQMINYLKSQKVLLAIEKEKLEKRRSFSFSPSLSSKQGDASIGCNGYVNINDYITTIAVEPMDKYFTNSVNLSIPVINSNKRKRALYQSIITLTMQKSSLETEKIVFEELQALFLRFIEIDKFVDEIALREVLCKKTDSIIGTCTKLYEHGIVPERSLHSLVFFNENNQLSTSVLKKRIYIAQNRVMNEYCIDSVQLRTSHEACAVILGGINCRSTSKMNDTASYNEAMYAIENEILEKNIRLSSNREYQLSCGPAVYFDRALQSVTAGIASTISIELFPSRPVPKGILSARRPVMLKDITNMSIDAMTKRHILNADDLTKKSLEEIGLGNINSLYSLTGLLDELLNQQIDLSSLQHEEVDVQVASFKKMDDFLLKTVFTSMFDN